MALVSSRVAFNFDGMEKSAGSAKNAASEAKDAADELGSGLALQRRLRFPDVVSLNPKRDIFGTDKPVVALCKGDGKGRDMPGAG